MIITEFRHLDKICNIPVNCYFLYEGSVYKKMNDHQMFNGEATYNISGQEDRYVLYAKTKQPMKLKSKW